MTSERENAPPLALRVLLAGVAEVDRVGARGNEVDVETRQQQKRENGKVLRKPAARDPHTLPLLNGLQAEISF